MNRSKHKILFVHQGLKSFVHYDYEILNESYEVLLLNLYSYSLKNLSSLFGSILRTDLVFIWFLGRHAILPLLLAALLKKRVILVPGGWDAAACPEIGYGLMMGARKKWVRMLYHLATKIVAISEANRNDIEENVDKNLKSKIRLIYQGFYEEAVAGAGEKAGVLTVGGVNRSNLVRKGLLDFVHLSRRFPGIPFVIIGKWEDEKAVQTLRSAAGENVFIAGEVSDSELNEWMCRSKIYVQLSYHEGFGCAVAEAMLRECIPVVTDRYALPEVVGETGYIVSYGNMDQAEAALKQALADNKRGPAARHRILSHFPLKKRNEALKTLVKEVLADG